MLCREAGRVGAFINLESTGPGGPDILFQASGQHLTLCCLPLKLACIRACIAPYVTTAAYVATFACSYFHGPLYVSNPTPA